MPLTNDGIEHQSLRSEIMGTRTECSVETMKDSAKYAKIVEWSDEDQCYVGSAPGLIYGGCHGGDERRVFEELCKIVEETIELYRKEGRRLPPATSGRDLANRLQSVA